MLYSSELFDVVTIAGQSMLSAHPRLRDYAITRSTTSLSIRVNDFGGINEVVNAKEEE
jgi:hypothetical protein